MGNKNRLLGLFYVVTGHQKGYKSSTWITHFCIFGVVILGI